MTAFVLPDSPDAADAALDGLGALATATEWRRSAIVHARVLPKGLRRDPDCNSAIRRVTANRFSKRGVHGLTSPHTVQAYRDAWQAAVDDGLTGPAALGGEVVLPDAEWSAYHRRARRGGEPEPAEPVHALTAAVKRLDRDLSELCEAVDRVTAETAFLHGGVGAVGPLLLDIAGMRWRLDGLDRHLRQHEARTGPELATRVKAAIAAGQRLSTGAQS